MFLFNMLVKRKTWKVDQYGSSVSSTPQGMSINSDATKMEEDELKI